MCMIWQAIVLNGQQKPLDIPTFLALYVVVIAAAAAATTARAIVTSATRTVLANSCLSAQFYICRTEHAPNGAFFCAFSIKMRLHEY